MSSFTLLEFFTPSISDASSHFLVSLSYSNRLGPLIVIPPTGDAPDRRRPPDLLIRALLVDYVVAFRSHADRQDTTLSMTTQWRQVPQCRSPDCHRNRRRHPAPSELRPALRLPVCCSRPHFRRRRYTSPSLPSTNKKRFTPTLRASCLETDELKSENMRME